MRRLGFAFITLGVALTWALHLIPDGGWRAVSYFASVGLLLEGMVALVAGVVYRYV